MRDTGKPRKKNNIAVEESGNDDFEPLDNDSDEPETENEMKTGAEDDEFLDVISTERYVNFDCG
jgi:hypothetical protein